MPPSSNRFCLVNEGPRRDIVLFNAAAALVAADFAADLNDGVKIAAEAIDSGEAKKTLVSLREFSKMAAAKA